MVRRVVELLIVLSGLVVWYVVQDPAAARAAGVTGVLLYIANLVIEKALGDRLVRKSARTEAPARTTSTPVSEVSRPDRPAITTTSSPTRPVLRISEQRRQARPRIQRRTILIGAASIAAGGLASWLIVEHKRDDALETLKGHTDLLFSVRFSPDGKTVATGSMDKTIRLWDPEKAASRNTLVFDRPGGGLADVNFSPDGSTIMASVGWSENVGQQVAFWDARRGVVSATNAIPGQRSTCAMSPNGLMIATGGDQKNIALWDTKSWKLLGRLAGHTGNVLDIAFSPDGWMLASISDDKTVRLWNVGTNKQASMIVDNDISNAGGNVTFSPDGTQLAYTKSYRTLKIWPLNGRQPVRAVNNGVHHAANTPVFSPDGQRIACADQWEGRHVIRIFETDTGVDVKMLYGHDGPITSLAYSPDGATLASASFDKTARLWSPK